MIDHVLIYVTHLEKSKAFYEAAFLPLGYKIAFGEEGKFCSFSVGNGCLFEIAQMPKGEGESLAQNGGKAAAITPCHVAFRGRSREDVHAFYAAACAAGGVCNGPPGPRPHYTPTYYATFIKDPSGHNIEVMTEAS